MLNAMNAIIQNTTDACLGIERSVTGQRWALREVDDRQAQAIAQRHALPDVVARLLAGRGVALDAVADYLAPSLRHALCDPSDLQDMDNAASRLADAIQSREAVGLFADYDVDGATSAALMTRYLRALGVRVETHIPDRITEGYGPTIAGFDGLIGKGAKLLITLDCGTVSFEPIAHARARNVDVLVVDHHLAEGHLPEATAIVNPNRMDDRSGCTMLSAAGVAFMLLIATNRVLRQRGFFEQANEPNLLQWIDLVALGAVCDVMPLVGANRALVSQGLKVMAQRGNSGIRALCDVARMDEAPTTYHAGFIVGPRINAGGRVGEARLGYELLTTDDAVQAQVWARKLDTYNAERQAIESVVLEQATEQAQTVASEHVALLAGEGWHVGVIGVVAGRLKERLDRPVAVVGIENGVGKGSARSVPGVDFGAAMALAKAEGLLIAGGGHAMAAGFTVEASKIEALRDFLSKHFAASVARYRANRSLKIDAIVHPAGCTLELAEQIAQAGPFGAGNPQPLLLLPDVRIHEVQWMKEQHLRLSLRDAAGTSAAWVQATCFRCADTKLGEALSNSHGRRLHIAATLGINHWNGQRRPQLTVQDAAFAE